MASIRTRTLHYRHWSVWLALLVAVFAAIAPTVSHALVHARGAATPGFEICTSKGPQWIAADPAPVSTDSPTRPESVLALDHCPFCLHQADRVVPPPTPVAYLFSGLGGQQEVTASQALFYPGNTYSRATPRGPPEPS